MNIENIDIDSLRRDLIDYYTSAMFMVSPIALMDVTKVENASDDELIQIAIDNRFDLNKYIINKYTI
jgi:succinyl-CoA synthetase beta subunit